MRTAERGFTLLELTICVAILAIASAATAGAFAALARTAAPPAARDAALTAAENALARARAATAYAPSAAAPADRTWALTAGTTQSVAGGQLAGAAPCGSPAPRPLLLPMSTSFDPSQQRFTVTVTYPRDPCAVGGADIAPNGTATVTLSETIPPSAYAPGTSVYRDVATPARM